MQAESSHPSGAHTAASYGFLVTAGIIGVVVMLVLLYAFW